MRRTDMLLRTPHLLLRTAPVRLMHRGEYRYICSIHPSMHGKIVVR